MCLHELAVQVNPFISCIRAILCKILLFVLLCAQFLSLCGLLIHHLVAVPGLPYNAQVQNRLNFYQE